MKKMVAIVLMLVGFVGSILPDSPVVLNYTSSTSTQSASVISNESVLSAKTIPSFEIDAKSSHHEDCDDCRNSSDVCHHCHFGHYGFVTNADKFSLFQVSSQYGKLNQNFHLNSFITNLFRPPIV